MTRRSLRGVLFIAAAAAVISFGMPVRAQFPMGGAQPDRPVVAQFDKDGDKRLNAAERKAAREALGTQGGGRGFRGGFGPGGNTGPVGPGPQVTPAAVRTFPSTVPFYDPGTLRTLFLEFENGDWEKELMAFKDTDVEVPATLMVDGKTYRDVAVQFRGASSFMMVPEGLKHSLDISLDTWEKKQDIQGFTSLNLLNGNGDASLIRGMLYLTAARDYIPAARANLVRVVINGESWGIYSNVEQVNKDFIDTWFKTEDGARWKVPGSPNGRGGLEYLGGNVDDYKRLFEIKSKDDPKAWEALVRLTKVLNETPAGELEAALRPILDIDGVLRFLALDNTLVNSDGYWTRASDYNIYLDPKGIFHVVPHDANETFMAEGGPGGGRFGRGGGRGFGGPPPGADVFRGAGPGMPPGGPGFPGGPGRGGPAMGGGPTLDLLVGLTDSTKPLRSKLLSVPSLQARYLAYCKEIAAKWLDWKTLEPMATKAHGLVAADVKADTRKLVTNEAFETSLVQLKAFVDERRAYVLNYTPPAPAR